MTGVDDAGGFLVRQLVASDAILIHKAFSQLSLESRYLRYGLPVRDPASVLGWIGDLDGIKNAAVGAIDPMTGSLVGGARYTLVDEESYGEVAGFVIDAWQGRGIGAELLSDLLRHARWAHVGELRAYVLPENRRARRLLASTSAWRVLSHRDGLIEYGSSLWAPHPGGHR